MIFRIWVELLCLDMFLVGINQDSFGILRREPNVGYPSADFIFTHFLLMRKSVVDNISLNHLLFSFPPASFDIQ